MKYFCFIVLTISFLLSGCFSGKEYPSGLLDNSELRQSREKQRMTELKQSKTIRLGFPANEKAEIAGFQKKLEAGGWKVQLVECPGKRLTGLLRSGALDIIYVKESSENSAEQLCFYYLAPSFLVRNQLLHQELKRL